MLNGMKKSQPFVHDFQKIIIMKELQKIFGEIYLGGKCFSTDMFLILTNIRINCQMNASKFEELLYNMLSEEPFANHRLDTTDENKEYKISDYVSQHLPSQ